MKRRMIAAAAASIALGAGAKTEGLRLTGYGSFDLASGYVLYGARENDEPCYWAYGELNLGYDGFGSLGVGLWQNTDMTARRKDSMRRMNEWDYSVFYRYGIDFIEGWRLDVEAGHLWYNYHGLTPSAEPYYHTMAEWYGRVSLENPYVVPYFGIFYDHGVYQGAFMLAGLKRGFELPLGLTLTPEWQIGGGTRNYNECMYPPFDGSVSGGVTFTELACTLAYWFNDHFGVHARVAYTVLVDDDVRNAINDMQGGTYATDHVWGNVGVDVAF